MTIMTAPTLPELYRSLQKEMKTRIEIGRESLDHPTEKGGDSELHWSDWLAEFLPYRYQVDKAYVIDSRGNQSEQIDLVIYDRQYSPPIFKHGKSIFVSSESVYAIFEVKQHLNKQHMDYAKKKAKSVRTLYRTSVPIVHAGGIERPKPPKPIYAGILAYDSDWNPPFGLPFRDSLKISNPNEAIDIGCVICDGGFDIKNVGGRIEKSKPEYSLVFFFLKLLARLQSIGTVTAIDISKYMGCMKGI